MWRVLRAKDTGTIEAMAPTVAELPPQSAPTDRRTGDSAASEVTFEEYLRLNEASERRLEYDEGTVLPMPTPQPLHDLLAKLISKILESSLGANMLVYAGQGAVRRGESRVYCPDVVAFPLPMTTEPVGSSYALTEPIVIAEVLSPSAESLDRGRKLQTYLEKPSLRAYLLVDQSTPCVEWYAREEESADWTYHVAKGRDAVATFDVRSDGEAVRVEVPLAELYAAMPDEAVETSGGESSGGIGE